MKIVMSFLCFFLLANTIVSAKENSSTHFFAADNQLIQYAGRIDFRNTKLPRFWAPGVYITACFKGSYCTVEINDEMLYGKNHNYIEIVVDDKTPLRMQLKEKHNIIEAAKDLVNGKHTLTICKNTEAGIGYLEFAGINCAALVKSKIKPHRKIECFGNSITCGTGSDQSETPCDKGVWQDQHNAYMSYGAVTARSLNAQWQLSAVSGIGLMHSCCNLAITMPQVYDKINMRDDSVAWNFDNYIPDVVTVCLGQNDGIQDSVVFCSRYIEFIKTLRSHYAAAKIICLTSPMADEHLVAVMKNYLTGIVNAVNKEGDDKVYKYFFLQRYYHGCDTHPDLAEHQLIAAELSAYIKTITNW